jgi:hypothetical protein
VIENLLKSEESTLDDLLDEDDLLQEVKNSNPNLLRWMTRDRVKELLNYIILMPEVDEHNKGHK